MKFDHVTRLIQICLDIANMSDESGEKKEQFLPELGLGYGALSRSLRDGCKGVIELQDRYHRAVQSRNLAKISEKDAHDFLEDVFGDREPYTINDRDKERIKEFVASIKAEWEEQEHEPETAAASAAECAKSNSGIKYAVTKHMDGGFALFIGVFDEEAAFGAAYLALADRYPAGDTAPEHYITLPEMTEGESGYMLRLVNRESGETEEWTTVLEYDPSEKRVSMFK